MTKHLDLDALQAAAEAATPGKWMRDADPVKGDPLGRKRAQVVATGRTITQGYYTDEQGEKDAAFIAAFNPQTCRALIDRLRKAEAQHADLLKSMFEIAWSNDSQWQTDAAKQACLRNPALSYRAAPDSTPTDSADSEGASRADQA